MNNDMIGKVLADPSASYWLKCALRSLVLRDPVDAASDLEVLRACIDDRARSEDGLDLPWRVVEVMPLYDEEPVEIHDSKGHAVVSERVSRETAEAIVYAMNERGQLIRERDQAIGILGRLLEVGGVDQDSLSDLDLEPEAKEVIEAARRIVRREVLPQVREFVEAATGTVRRKEVTS